MREKDLAALWITGPSDHNPFMYYFTGGQHLSVSDLIKPVGKKSVLFYYSVERDEAAATGLKTIDYKRYKFHDLLMQTKGDELKAVVLRLVRMFTDLGLTKGRVMLYGKTDFGWAYDIARGVHKALPGLTFVGDYAFELLMTAMMTKDADEVARVRAMGTITTGVVGRTAEFLTSHKAKNGRLVKRDGTPLIIADVKKKINLWLAEAGAENPEDCIFSIGRDAAIGHSAGTLSDELTLGKTIVFDIFPCEPLGGYYYDFTRTWCLGYAPDEEQQLYDDVKAVYDTVVRELKPGQPVATYQHRTCELFASKGHPTLEQDPEINNGYNHCLGHGIGLREHERPYFEADSQDKIVKCSTFTIEPGLYYPEKGMGARIEDSYYVTPDGRIECLAPYPHDLVLKVKGINWMDR